MTALFSCNDLEEYNPGGTTADAIWSTPEGFVTLVNATYSDQREIFGKADGMFMLESGTDLWFNERKQGYADQITQYNGLTPADGNPNRALWRILWKGINHANAGINRINDAGFTDPVEENHRLGELRFLRGMYYYYLVETYGGVMLRTKETQDVILTAERSPVEDFYEVILTDLEFAAENLPESYGDEYSRATEKSALGFLARALLSRAWYAQGAERDEYFGRARDIAKKVIDEQARLGVELWDNFEDVFDPRNNKNNKEALYIMSNSLQNPSLNFDVNGNRLHELFTTNYANKPGLLRSLEYGHEQYRRLMPTLAFLDFFDEESDARYAGSFREVWITNTPLTWTAQMAAEYGKDPEVIGTTMEAGEDTALYITKKAVTDKSSRPYLVYDRNDMYNPDGSINEGLNFVSFTKFEDPLTRASADERTGYLDVIVMRLAEMYLIAAEAELQLGNPGVAADYINVIRERAAYPGMEAEMEVDGGIINIDFILDERARELGGEFVRWLDLKRTGKLLDRVNRLNPDITLIRDFHVLRPVPQAEIDALENGEEFKNNQGY